jgi:uncharacterized RDD family membrane protein YckC
MQMTLTKKPLEKCEENGRSMREQYQQEELWRIQVAERVAAHKARRPSQQQPAASAPTRQTRAPRSLSPEAQRPATDLYSQTPQQPPQKIQAQQLTERAVENVRRRLEERQAREEAELREREELELFFTEFNRPVEPAEPAPRTPPPPSNLIAFPRANNTATAPIALPEEEPLPDQLTIFEAIPEFEPDSEYLRPRALRLDEHLDFSFDEEEDHDPEALFDLPLKVAPIALRAWAGAIDSTVVGCCALGFTSIFYGIQHELPKGKPALITALIVFWVIWTIYQVLFLTYASATPGLKVMRLGISNFEDEVPDVRTRIKRAIALLFTSMSCGLGFIWTLLDEDRLAWHDRMTRTYPRQLA